MQMGCRAGLGRGRCVLHVSNDTDGARKSLACAKWMGIECAYASRCFEAFPPWPSRSWPLRLISAPSPACFQRYFGPVPVAGF